MSAVYSKTAKPGFFKTVFQNALRHVCIHQCFLWISARMLERAPIPSLANTQVHCQWGVISDREVPLLKSIFKILTEVIHIHGVGGPPF